jgi:hypothetical protein
MRLNSSYLRSSFPIEFVFVSKAKASSICYVAQNLFISKEKLSTFFQDGTLKPSFFAFSGVSLYE